MNAMRAAFAFAFILIGIGVFATRSLVKPLFLSDSATKAQVAAVRIATGTPHPTVRPQSRRHRVHRHTAVPDRTATPTATSAPTRTPMPTLTPLPTSTPISTRISIAPHKRRPVHRAKPTPTPHATPTPRPTATQLAGTITLARYWVNSPQAAPGQTIGVAYVIENDTGRVMQVSLGASIKSRRVLSWGASLSDPAHDVVAVVPLGASTHLRFFHLPGHLRQGAYDVAWGLRNSVTGSRIALAESGAALVVAR